MTSSSTNIRASTNLMFYFNVPNNAVMTASEYVVIELPWGWAPLPTMMDGSWTGSATMTMDVWDASVVPATNTPETIAVTCSMVAAGTLVVTPDNDADGVAVTLAENKNYTVTLSGVPTPENALDMALGSFTVGVGLTASGLTGRSSSMLNTWVSPNMAVAPNMVATEWADNMATVSRGTYSNTMVCVMSAAGNFVEDVSFGVVAGTIALHGDMSASLGDATACGCLGADQTA
jgi:hypothetical protein